MFKRHPGKSILAGMVLGTVLMVGCAMCDAIPRDPVPGRSPAPFQSEYQR